MSTRNYTNTASEAELGSSVTGADATVGLTNYTGFPATPFIAAIDRTTADEEIVLVTDVVGTTVTMTRGYDGTTAKSHAAGASFLHVASALDFREANDHVNDTAGAHGVIGDLVGTSDAQTLTNKTLTSPQIDSATINSPTITSPTFSGATAFDTASVAALTVTTTAVVPAPSLGTHAATKTYVDAGDSALDTRLDAAEATLTAATSSEVANTLVERDSTGHSVFTKVSLSETPTSATHAASKSYVDAAEADAKAYADGLVSASDSGWVTVPTASGRGVYQTPQVRKIGSVVYARGGWTNSGMSANTSYTGGTIPVGYRPATTMVGHPGMTSAGSTGRMTVHTDGTVQIDTGGSVAGYFKLDFLIWTVD